MYLTTDTDTHVCICRYTNGHEYIPLHTYIYTCMYEHFDVRMYIYVYVYIHLFCVYFLILVQRGGQNQGPCSAKAPPMLLSGWL